MMLKHSIFITLLLFSISAEAGYKQKITVCANVNSYKSVYKFRVKGQSTDFFDEGFWTSYISNGRACWSHTYNHGPKNMVLSVQSRGVNKRSLKYLDRNCSLHTSFYNEMQTRPKKMEGKNVTLTVNINQEEASNKYIYSLSCEQSTY